jgi:hypothetical protein
MLRAIGIFLDVCKIAWRSLRYSTSGNGGSRDDTENAFSTFRDSLEHALLEGEMTCNRCQRWMVNEKYYGAGLPFWGWRCVCCGEILDPVILKNRNNLLKIPLAGSQRASAERRGR